MSKTPDRPDYDDAVAHVDRLKSEHPRLVETREIGSSVQGRAIPCAIVTDPSAAADDKQHVLMVAGQHGSEESGRAMVMALMDWLVSGADESGDVLRKQVLAFVPCASPDGSLNESSRNAEGVDIPHTYALDAPALTPEGRAIEAFAMEFVPDVVVDAHGRGGGGMKEEAWVQPAHRFSSDRLYLTLMSQAMAQAGEEAGFPQTAFHPPGILQFRDGHDAMLGEMLAWRCKTLGLGLESIEQYYRQADWEATGLPRLRRLLRFGMEDAFGLGVEGYPNVLVSGQQTYGLMAHGRTAAERRASRVELTRFLTRNFAMVDRDADGVVRCAKVKVLSQTCEGDNPQRFSVLLRIKNPCQIGEITWKGQPLPAAEGHGYRTWTDACSTFVQIDIAEPFGGPERFLVVNYDCPYFQ